MAVVDEEEPHLEGVHDQLGITFEQDLFFLLHAEPKKLHPSPTALLLRHVRPAVTAML